MTSAAGGVSSASPTLELVEARVRAAVARRRDTAGDAADPLRGLYLSEDDVDRLLLADRGAPNGPLQERLRRLTQAFALEPLDSELLLIALAPDLDARFERLYGYLHDDVTQRRASIGLALELAGASPTAVESRRRLTPRSPLVAGGLVIVEEPDRPFLTRSLRVPDRVALHLLGDDRPDPGIADMLVRSEPCDVDGSALARAIAAGAWLCYLHERRGGAGLALATAAFRGLGSPSIALDLGRIGSVESASAVALAASREARLVGAGLIAAPIDDLVALGGQAVHAFAELPWPVILIGSRSWDPSWSRRVPLIVEPESLPARERERIWLTQLGDEVPAALDAAALTAQFRLGPEEVARAAKAARLRAAYAGRPVDVGDLGAGAREQNSAGLERLARRIEPAVTWRDLVLPGETIAHLKELAARARHRDRVLAEWRLGGSKSRGSGITALFAGESGTGKTMAAEVLCAELRLDLYAIDLATVVDKYVGETEKNLDRIFVEAEHVNGVLFFDEADALFGKRSEVQDAHDRYANVEVAYLLQRMELFDGIAILATNLRSNLDEAFTRRLDVLVDFPMPDEEHRLRLWSQCLGDVVPRSDDLDLEFCARAFELSGGNIRNIVLAAAYLAAEGDRELSMADLIRGTEREYRKLGRLCLEAEFGPYYELLGSPAS